MLRKRWVRITVISLVAIILIVRAVLPGIILNKLNNYLENFSPVYSIHIDKLHLGFLTFSYTARDMEGHYKKDGSKFLHIDRTRVQISFPELLHGRILTNVRIDKGAFIITKPLLAGSKEPEAKPKESAKKAADKVFPLRIAVIELHDSSIDVSDFVPEDSKNVWRISSIEAKILNINPLPENPYTSAFVEGKMLDKYPIKIVAKAKRLEKPLAWKLDLVSKEFPLPAANPVLMHYLPFSFTKGFLDLYSEIKSQNGGLEGYFKPFMKDVQVLHANEHFKNAKHFMFEIAGAFANFMLKRADDKTLATKISFKEENGHFKVESGEALKDAVKNGYSEKPLSPGIEDSVPFN